MTIPLTIEELSDQPIPTGSLAFDTPIVRRIETEQRFDFNGSRAPLMRCLLLQHTVNTATMILTFHHSIADASSAVIVTRNIITILAHIKSGISHELPLPYNPEPLEHFIPAKHSGLFAFGKFSLHSLRQAVSRVIPGQRHVPIDNYVLPFERHERFIKMTFDSNCTNRLITATRQQNCTVHSTLCAAQLLALKEEYPSKNSIRIWLLSLVDIRRRLKTPVSSENLNLMISMVESLFSITTKTSLWDLACNIHCSNKALINKGFHYYYFPTMTRILRATHSLRSSDLIGSQQMLRQGQHSRPNVLTVSNIGRINMSTDFGQIRCEELSFFIPLSSAGLIGSSANTFNGKLHWNFSYADPAVSQERAVRLAQRSAEIISTLKTST